MANPSDVYNVRGMSCKKFELPDVQSDDYVDADMNKYVVKS